jgi:fructoselysine-6-P-deglycase FrlB-like protein
MSYVSDEISTQPDCWVEAAALAAVVDGSLPADGERVAAIGCGTSYNVALAYAALREGTGHGFTDAMPASEVRSHRTYDRYLFFSRSGTTTEVVQALGQVPRGTPSTAFTANGSSPVATGADSTVLLEFAAERSVVQTRFATSLLILLRAHLGDDVSGAISDARLCLNEPLPEGTLEANRLTFLGRGWTVGVAHEAALKLREAALLWTESYPAMEFRHGPISVVDERAVVWSFGPPPPDLEEQVVPTGARFVASERDPLAELIRAQRLAVERATASGLDPDRPRHLAFSVILN